MPRVVPDQREKFENDELFRKMSRESEVSGYIRCLVIGHSYRCISFAWLDSTLWRGRVDGVHNNLQPTLDSTWW